MDKSDLQARGEALLAELKAQGISRNCIHDDLMARGFTFTEASDLLDGVPLTPRPPPPPSLDELILHSAREMIAARETMGNPHQASGVLENPRTMRFWEEVLGGRNAADWVLELPEVAAAIDADDRLELHRLLSRQRSAAPSIAALDLLDEVLANERLFVAADFPIPSRRRFLYFRFRLRPEGLESERLGTSLGTVWLTFWFVPLVPVSRFLIAPGPSFQWEYVGQLPLPRSLARWKGAATLSLMALLAWVLFRVVTRDA